MARQPLGRRKPACWVGWESYENPLVTFRYIVSLAVLLAPAAWPQSQASTDDVQQLRKLVDQMQAQMNRMQAEIDQLKGTKTEAPSTQPTPAATAPSPSQRGTLQTEEPVREGPRA